MEWMHDIGEASSEIALVGFKKAPVIDGAWTTAEFQSNQHDLSNPRLVIFNLDSKKKIGDLDQLKQRYPECAFVLLSSLNDTDTLSEAIRIAEPIQILKDSKNLEKVVENAFKQTDDQLNYHQSLKKLKVQNKKLETLNEDLESLVHERTKKEFQANKMTESSLKSIQGILSFIKLVSRIENVDDLLSVVKNEFKKVHGLMPPILLLSPERSPAKFYFFQGKQLTRKLVDQSETVFMDLDDKDLRMKLSNAFGRPFSGIVTEEFKFQSKELDGLRAKIIFEHSLSEKVVQEFFESFSQRQSIIGMALENICLKKNLHDSAKQWSNTFNEIRDPIVIVDSLFNVTLSNRHYQKQLAAQGFDNSASQFAEAVERTFESGSPQYSDIHFKGHVYRVHSYPIHLPDDSSLGYVINQFADITQSIDLQSKVVQGEKMAAVGLLAGNIAHELNNPLTGIYSLAELLVDDLKPGTNTFKDLSEIKDAAARCQRIIKDLLDFTSVGSESKTRAININDLVAKTLPLLKMAMRSLNADVQLSETELMVECNPQLMQQVVFNLINNACQAMGEEGTLKVRTEQRDGWAVVRVQDTGPGIPEDIKRFIFDPFFTTKEEGKGTGLGLSMSRSVVEKHGGRLELNEDYNEGTEFQILLPVVK